MDLVFVNINPSLYSVERGHYFSRRSNKFWPALSRSALTARMRAELGVEELGPEHDVLLPRFGIGFTDLVKRPTARASDVSRAEFAAGVPELVQKIERFQPVVVCFQGVTAYRHVHEALAEETDHPQPGLQHLTLAGVPVFLVPNPSGANAHVSRADQTAWYDCLSAFIAVSG